MKPHLSLLFGLGIGAGFLVLETGRGKRLTELEHRHAELVKQANALGLGSEGVGLEHRTATGRQSREGRLDVARRLHQAWIDIQNAPADDPGTGQKKTKLLLELHRLSADQLFFLWELSDRKPNEWTYRLLQQLAVKDFEKVLAFQVDDSQQWMLSYRHFALTEMAKNDPLRAQEWITENRESLGFYAHSSQTAILTLIAEKDPKQALQILDSLPAKNRINQFGNMVMNLKLGDSLSEVLPNLRAFSDSQTEPAMKDQARATLFSSLAHSIRNMGPEGVDLLATGELTEQEKVHFAEALSGQQPPKHPDMWIEWIGTNLPEDQSKRMANQFMTSWTRNDFPAAGEWLSSAPDGPLRQAAIPSYAEQIAAIDPASAIEWAGEIASEDDRKRTFRSIHQNWPQEDPEGKASFGNEHGF